LSDTTKQDLLIPTITQSFALARQPPTKKPMPVEQMQVTRFKRLRFRVLAENAVSEAKATELLGISVRQLNLIMNSPLEIQAALLFSSHTH
jgi:hypothetical protein